MGCVYHPNRDVVERCEECLAGLCDSCTVNLEDGRTLCNRCMVADFFGSAGKGQLRREDLHLGISKWWRHTYLKVVISVGAVLVVLLFGLRIYWGKPIQRPQINLDPANPMRLLTNLQFSLEKYAAAHKDRYPDNLYDLLPDILAETEENRIVLRMLNYGLDQREGYVLRIKENAPFSSKKLLATAEDIRLAEEE